MTRHALSTLAVKLSVAAIAVLLVLGGTLSPASTPTGGGDDPRCPGPSGQSYDPLTEKCCGATKVPINSNCCVS
jgi:hypothetical protein